MKGCPWRLKTWWFGHFGMGDVGVQLWLPFSLIPGTTSPKTTTHLCLCVSFEWSLFAWGRSSSKRSTATTHFRESLSALYWFVAVISCSGYLITQLFYFQMSSWMNYLIIHYIGITFVCCVFITTPCLPHKNFSRLYLCLLLYQNFYFDRWPTEGARCPNVALEVGCFKFGSHVAACHREVKGERSAPCKQPTAQWLRTECLKKTSYNQVENHVLWKLVMCRRHIRRCCCCKSLNRRHWRKKAFSTRH